MTLASARFDNATTTASSSLPRFILRKRSVSESDDGCDSDRDAELKLPTVTSAFLSGLFADVAQVVHEAPNEATDPECRPVKKSRVSLHRSMSRCGRSFKNLAAAASLFGNSADSPTGVADLVSDVNNKCPLIPRLSKNDSLHFQLRCVVGGGAGRGYSSEADRTVLEAGELAFPNLPNTVSNSSCSTLTRNLSDLQTSFPENNDKEAYGWFVAVDEDPAHPKDDPPSRSAAIAEALACVAVPTTDLAFVAPTAPHAINQDDEVEWAKAADMVDDVLGDFF